jgi:hypothetical protein
LDLLSAFKICESVIGVYVKHVTNIREDRRSKFVCSTAMKMGIESLPRTYYKENKMNPISMKEAIHLLETNSPQEMMGDERITDLISRIDLAVTEILSPLDNEYLSGMVLFMKAAALSVLIQEDDTSMADIKFMFSDTFEKAVMIVMKLSVGMSATEELR